MGKKNYYRQDLFNLYLEEFVKYSSDVRGAALVAADGFALASAGDNNYIENLDALSSVAADVIKRARVNFGLEANEIVIAAPDGDRVVCRLFEHSSETSGDYTLVLRCTGEHDRASIDALIGKLSEALRVFY